MYITDNATRDAGQNGKKVFNAVLEDSTGVISIAAWNQHADELSSVLLQLEHAHEQTPGVEYWLRVDLFSINQMKNSPKELCPIGSIQTIPAVPAKRNQVVSGSSCDAAVVDVGYGTQFAIVKASEVHTPSASRTASLRSSITGSIKRQLFSGRYLGSRVDSRDAAML